MLFLPTVSSYQIFRNGHIRHAQMRRGDLLQVSVGVHAAVQPQIGQLGEQVHGGRERVLHPVDINRPRGCQHPHRPAQILRRKGFQSPPAIRVSLRGSSSSRPRA